MIALDTNVLVRFLVEDDEVQAAKATSLFEQAIADGNALFISALAAFSSGKGDFADYVIREHGLAAGCNTVATFEQALLKETGYRSP